MQKLIEGYRAFRDGQWPLVRQHYQRLAEGQKPRMLVIACSDSRVDPHTIFNVGPGEIFVVRNVANIVPPCEQGEGLHGTAAAIEFAVAKLQVKTILVLGHARCGGVTAALDRTIGADTLFLAPWIELLEPARGRVARASDPQTALERESIVVSMERLAAYPFVAQAIRDRGLNIEGARFGVADGRLEIFDPATKSFQNVT